MPKISVIMPTYNSETYLKEAIDSILNQTFSDFEFLIIDDDSQDKTKEIIKSYADKRIRLLDGLGKGISAALNIGLQEAKGDYIARMDSDDIALPERFSAQFAFMEKHPDIGICGTQVGSPNGGNKRYMTHLKDDVSLIDVLGDTPFCHSSIFMRKSVLDTHHLRYDEEHPYGEDTVFWKDVLQVTKGCNLPNIYLNYRVHGKNKTLTEDPDLRNVAIQKMKVSLLKQLFPSIEIDEKCEFRFLPDELNRTVRTYINKKNNSGNKLLNCIYSRKFTGDHRHEILTILGIKIKLKH
ncbi:MAG: glycosyltransferase [Alphaproteobacteria bacterium]|nr:glycosyltransferase [Alphaproteobacteria bacterium]